MSVKNKVICITGATTKVGVAVTKKIAKNAKFLVLVDENAKKLKDLSEECKDKNAKVIEIVNAMKEEEDVREIFKVAVEKCVKIDVLINLYFLKENSDTIEDDVVDIYKKIINSNIKHLNNLTQLSLPYLKENTACIVNISNAYTNSILGNIVPFNICKSAFSKFTESIALELAIKGVRLNAVHPNPILTKENSNDNTLSVTMDDMADFIVFLASDFCIKDIGGQYIIDQSFYKLK